MIVFLIRAKGVFFLMLTCLFSLALISSFPPTSNCGAQSFRLLALRALEAHNLTVHSHGHCANNQPDTKKDTLLPTIKFSLAFENSEEPDYVTEKYLQALNFGAVPVVIGAPNIQDFAPSDNSIIHIENEAALPQVAERMLYLMQNNTAYDEMLAWKTDGPSDQFLALVDIGTVGPECRLCLHLADRTRRGEKYKALSAAKNKRRPCACQVPATEGADGKGTDEGVKVVKPVTVHHLYIRERSTFEFRSLFVQEPLTVARLHAAILDLYGDEHQPVWARKRPSYRRKLPNGSWDLTHVRVKIHKVYPAGITWREALYGSLPDQFTVAGNGTMDKALRKWVRQNPCGEVEVTFV
jgi:glycoprotein 3-alpha-L-fucosyltransferase